MTSLTSPLPSREGPGEGGQHARTTNLLRRLTPPGRLGAAIVALTLACALLSPWISPYDPDALDVMDRFGRPSAHHWLGTDQLGRDLFSRILHGTTVAMQVSLSAIALAFAAGVPLGLLAATLPQPWRGALVAVFDVVGAFPSLVLALAVVAVFGASDTLLVLVVALTLLPQFGRVARAQALALEGAPYLEAERILGASRTRILVRHILPNVIGPLLVLASMEVPSVITIEAGLSFVGLGVRPPRASWGTLIYDGYAWLGDSALPVLTASVALAIATLGFTLFGEALRDAADPRSRAPR